jgi:hypothetical protein
MQTNADHLPFGVSVSNSDKNVLLRSASRLLAVEEGHGWSFSVVWRTVK